MHLRNSSLFRALSAWPIALFCLSGVHAATAVPPAAALMYYAERADDEFAWQQIGSGTVGITQTRFVELAVTSQIWRDAAWQHRLFILYPDSIDPEARQALLVLQDDAGRTPEFPAESPSPLPRDVLLFAQLAEHLRTPVAVMSQIPPPSWLGDAAANAAIAATLQEYLDGADADDLLLLPMAKSVLRGMDAVQQHARQTQSLDLLGFTLIGAEHHSWSAWLAAAVDARVRALVPMSVDVFGLPAQLAHAEETWGDVSAHAAPYAALPLLQPRGQDLLRIVDPSSYLPWLGQPKLIIHSTNGEHWPLDTPHLYWPDLPGEKYLLYLPNGGRGLNDYGRIVGGVTALQQRVEHNRPMPRLDWAYQEQEDGVELRIVSDPTPNWVQAWIAESDSADLRQAVWFPVPVPYRGGEASYRLERREGVYRAVFIEAEYSSQRSLPLYLSTTVRVVPPLDADEDESAFP